MITQKETIIWVLNSMIKRIEAQDEKNYDYIKEYITDDNYKEAIIKAFIITEDREMVDNNIKEETDYPYYSDFEIRVKNYNQYLK